MPATIHDLEVSDVKLSTLKPFHTNPRRGDVTAIVESLKANGQFAPIVVNIGTHTGRPNEILKGNHTAKAAKQLKWPTIKAVHVDVDDEAATRIMLADNKTGQLGDFDDSMLANLLVDLPDLDGTGYTPVDLEELLSVARDAAEDAADAATEASTPVGEKKPTPTPEPEVDAPNTDTPAARSHSLILSYSDDDYRWVTKRLTEVGDEWGTASNAETVRQLLDYVAAGTDNE